MYFLFTNVLEDIFVHKVSDAFFEILLTKAIKNWLNDRMAVIKNFNYLIFLVTLNSYWVEITRWNQKKSTHEANTCSKPTIKVRAQKLATPGNVYLFKGNSENTRKRKKYVRNMFKVDDKDTRSTPFRCLYCLLRIYFTPFSSVPTVAFEQVNVCWDQTYNSI